MPRLRQAPRHRSANQAPPAGNEHAQRSIHRIGRLLAHALWSGAWASVVSSVMVSAWSRRVAGSVPAGTNATSQWVWGERARHARGWTWRHTAVGYLIHHASSVFWSTGYEAWCARSPQRPLAKAVAVAVLAYGVDYHVVPRRLSPGFERRVSPAGMVCAYAGFALGLALARAARQRLSHRPVPMAAPRRTVAGPPSRHAGK